MFYDLRGQVFSFLLRLLLLGDDVQVIGIIFDGVDPIYSAYWDFLYQILIIFGSLFILFRLGHFIKA